MASCYKCSAVITQGVDSPMSSEAVCESCSSWLHACANCAFYDEYSAKKCREVKADFVFDRLGRNVCAFFKLKSGARTGEQTRKMSPRSEQNDRAGKARERLADLFR